MSIFELVSLIVGAITAVAYAVRAIYRYKTKSLPEDPVVKEIQMNAEIEKRLRSYIKEPLNADRAFIYQFMNGIQYYTGNHAQRFKGTYEVVGPGVSSEINSEAPQDVSRYTTMLQSIAQQEAYIVPDVEKLEDGKLRDKLTSRGTKSFAVVPITNLSGLLIGMLGVSYTRDKRSIEKKDLVLLGKEAAIISGYLNNQSSEKNWLMRLFTKNEK